MFVKRTLPVLIAFFVGLTTALLYYVPAAPAVKFRAGLTEWTQVIYGFAFLLGFLSISHLHARRIRRQKEGWGYSGIFFVFMILAVATGLWNNGKMELEAGMIGPGYGTGFGWVFWNLMAPLDATMFATLAFYVASTAYRTFRAKNVMAFLLLSFALIMLFGKTTIGVYLWNNVMRMGSILGMDEIVEWIMMTLNMPARRAILIGVALGMIATSLKIISGIERTYLGGKGE